MEEWVQEDMGKELEILEVLEVLELEWVDPMVLELEMVLVE